MSDGAPVDAAAAAEVNKRKKYSDEHTVFVKHLALDVTEADLRGLFQVSCLPAAAHRGAASWS